MFRLQIRGLCFRFDSIFGVRVSPFDAGRSTKMFCLFGLVVTFTRNNFVEETKQKLLQN